MFYNTLKFIHHLLWTLVCCRTLFANFRRSFKISSVCTGCCGHANFPMFEEQVFWCVLICFCRYWMVLWRSLKTLPSFVTYLWTLCSPPLSPVLSDCWCFEGQFDDFWRRTLWFTYLQSPAVPHCFLDVGQILLEDHLVVQSTHDNLLLAFLLFSKLGLPCKPTKSKIKQRKSKQV